MKQRVEEMEREANKLRELQAAAEKAERSTPSAEQVPMETEEDKAAADSRSIYVGNVRTKHSALASLAHSEAYRSTTLPRLKRFSSISRHVVPSTVLPSFATSSRDTRKGM